MFNHLIGVVVLVVAVPRTHGESTAVNSTSSVYNSTNLHIRSLEEGVLSGQPTGGKMKWFSALFDQYQWMNRLQAVDGEECRGSMKLYIDELYKGSFWAVKMYDASGRYNGQFFFGNDYWIGSWSLCYELQNKESNNKEVPPFSASFYVARIRININSKFTPITRQIHLGLCLPKSCDTADVKKLLVQERNEAASMTIVNVRPVPGNYSLLEDITFQIIGISGLITLLLVIVASVVEVLIKNKRNKLDAVAEEGHTQGEPSRGKDKITKEKNGSRKRNNAFISILLAFSVIRNIRKIITASTASKDAIVCLHGLRVFSIGWIILVHTYLQVFGVSRNKNLRTITERNFMYQTISNATFSVDTFFFISGLLVTLGFFRNEAAKDTTNGKESATESLFSSLFKFIFMLAYRFVRLTPAYLFVLGTNEVIMRYIHSNSVFTPAIIDHITCDEYWWRNALYINNFFPQAEFCMLWSWYIANDTQFFIIASILLLVAVRGRKQLKYVAVSMGVLLVSSWIVVFILAVRHQYVARVQEPFALFDELYDKPWMRIGPYLIGMFIGYMLFKVKGQLIFTPIVVILGWSLSLACLGALVYGLGKHGLVVPASAFYAALGHTAWGLSLAWITVACCSGYGGPFNLLFSCKLFRPLSRLTYGAYLVHPVLMCLTTFMLDGSLQIHNTLTVVIFFGNFVLSFVCAFVISLGFEAPAVNLIKIIF